MKHFALAAILAAAVSSAHAQNVASLTWTAPTVDTGGSPIVGTITYRVYRALKNGAKVVIGSSSVASFTDNTGGLLSGREYCWHVTAAQTFDSVESAESAPSAEACKRFPGGTPAPVTNLVVN